MPVSPPNPRMSPKYTYRYACQVADRLGPGAYFRRYEGGEYEAVWRELVLLDGLHEDDALLADATCVARETMRRSRFNIEIMVERMKYQYRNAEYPKALPFVPAAPAALDGIATLEQRVGVIPLSLGAWLGQIEEVNFLVYGRFRAWDPLCIWSLSEMLTGLWWDESQGEYLLPFSPDNIIKAGYGGGPAYAFAPADSSADVLIEGTPYAFLTRPTLPLVTYLRHCFTWGGFPNESPIGTLPTQNDLRTLPPLDGLMPI